MITFIYFIINYSSSSSSTNPLSNKSDSIFENKSSVSLSNFLSLDSFFILTFLAFKSDGKEGGGIKLNKLFKEILTL